MRTHKCRRKLRSRRRSINADSVKEYSKNPVHWAGIWREFTKRKRKVSHTISHNRNQMNRTLIDSKKSPRSPKYKKNKRKRVQTYNCDLHYCPNFHTYLISQSICPYSIIISAIDHRHI